MNPKASNPPDSLPNLVGYDIVEPLYLGSRTAVYRAIQTAQQRPVVIKVLRNEYPSFGELVQFRNQYTLAKNLSSPGIVQPLSLESLGNSYALVMEDWGGVALGDYIQQQLLGLVDVLTIALQIADILQDLSQHQVVHKDIKPANILIHPESKQVKLIDFSIASLLPKETQEIQSPNVLEGTLAYLAPEQTGRMNRGIDYRADFYALGVTLYELLSGTLPFTTINALELVHCHIAQIPQPVNQVNVAIPAMVAAIVTKLMAKNAEDRYQSALGLKHDLQQCLTQWEETGEILAFELGQRDVSDRFLIPEKLYGREAEVQTLLDAFDRIASPSENRVAQGSSELMLVAGFSGIGKTAIVNEVHKPITRQNGYFIKGKFDQFNRNTPLSAFVQALRDLMGQLLSESDAQLQTWKTQILAALGDNGQVLIDVIPELERIIGSQPAATELSGAAAQNRFNLLFQKFIQVFTTPEHPLVMFLDDLQWADSASLNLIQVLMTESTMGYLLLIGAYRDNEVFAAHPLMLTLDTLRKAETTVNTITLSPLDFTDVNQLTANTLHCAAIVAEPLTELVMQKTQGNPFFATQFLKALHQEKLINFDTSAGYWQCDIVQVREAALTDDVVEFMALQLQKLPSATQEILKLAACIGAQFDLNTLAIVSEQSETEVATVLWKALQEGLIVPQSEVYKFYLERENENPISDSPTARYKFLHDRVQQAAYSLIPEAGRAIAHYQIGQLILQKTPIAAQEENIFILINQLNYGISLIADQDERDQLAQLNLVACRKARTSIAYKTAQNYAIAGLQLLGEQAWQRLYDLTLALHDLAAEVSMLNGEYESMERYFTAIIQSAKTPLDQVKVYQVKIEALASSNQSTQAVEMGLAILALLGVPCPQNPVPEDIQAAIQTIVELMGDRAIESLFDLAKATDPQQIAVVQIATSLTPVCYVTGSPLFPLMIALQVQRSIEFGNTPTSAFGYACYGILLNNGFRNVEAADQFGQLAYRLVLEPDARNIHASTLTAIANFLHHRKSHLQNSIQIYQDGYQVGLETGALEHVGYCASFSCLYALWCGQGLSELESQMRTYHTTLLHLNQMMTAASCAIYWDVTLTLLDQPKPFSLDYLQGSHAEAEVAQKLAAKEFMWLHLFYVHRFILSYWLEDFAQAAELSISARQFLSVGAGFIGEVIFYFYDSLMALSEAGNGGAGENVLQNVSQRLQDNQIQLKHWADYAPMNHLHKWQLVEAETQRVMGNRAAAIDLYDRAISGAKANEYIQEEALANELAAKFYLDWGKEKVAAGYMQEAYYCYAKWGAKAKTDDLETRYPDLLRPILQPVETSGGLLSTLMTIAPVTVSTHSSTRKSSSSSSINQTLDFAAILKASQSLSRTIQLDELLSQLTQIILQNSGGDRCALILPNDAGEWMVRAIATPDNTELCTQPLAGNPNLPVKLIQYVKNTQEVVVIDDLETELPVIGNYLRQRQPKSVLCLPILNQGHLIGILYLKNRLTSGVFTSDRILILNFLCTQAAISLENARLYQVSRQYTEELQRSLLNLQQSEMRFAEVFNHSSDAILLLGDQGFIDCNPAAVKLFGYIQTDELCKIHPSQISPEFQFNGQSSFDEANAMIAIALKHGNHRFEWLHQRANGEIFWAEVMLTLIPYDGEQILHSLVRDISDRKQSDALIQQKSQELEHVLKDLQQSQLVIVQGEKMASLGNLVAGVAHEINNPIGFLNGSIKNATDYVQDLLTHIALYQQHHPNAAPSVQDHAEDIDLEFLSEDLTKLLTSMKNATDRIKGISTSLRTFSRADTEHTVSANLHDGIDSTLLILKYRLKANEHRPEIQVLQQYGELPLIQCFPGQLNQVFMNILANAIDVFDEMAQQSSFADLEAHPQILTIQTTIASLNTVEIRIRDNGKGMSEDVKVRIFDHLFTTKGVGKGTGLGLAIARQIVEEKHGGSLDVQSVVGQGTEFCIRLAIAG